MEDNKKEEKNTDSVLKNNQQQKSDDFFAIVRGEDAEENKQKKSKKVLLPREKALAAAEFSPIIIVLSVIVAFIFWLLFFANVKRIPYYLYGEIAWAVYFPIALVFTIVALFALLSIKFQAFVITNKRVIAYYGFIIRIAFELKIDQVESITVYQGIIGSLFGYGTVQVCGIGASKARVHFVKNPFEFRQHFFDMKYKEKLNYSDR